MAYRDDSIVDNFNWDKFRDVADAILDEDGEPLISGWDMDDAEGRGYVQQWVVRLAQDNTGRYNEPLIEFYSADTDQFVSDYYVSTLLESPNKRSSGLDLWGDVASWKISGQDYMDILDWVEDTGV